MVCPCNFYFHEYKNKTTKKKTQNNKRTETYLIILGHTDFSVLPRLLFSADGEFIEVTTKHQ